MKTRSSDENSVCLSVCLSVRLSNARIVTKIIGGGRPLVPEILGQSYRVGAKSSIFDLFSLVATQP